MDGAKGAALPLIRHDLALSYAQVGLLASVPLLVGGALELPLGILAGDGPRRRRFILGGGIVFILSLLAVAGARSFAVLLAAFTVFYPASGAFVSLTQAELMDAGPDRSQTYPERGVRVRSVRRGGRHRMGLAQAGAEPRARSQRGQRQVGHPPAAPSGQHRD